MCVRAYYIHIFIYIYINYIYIYQLYIYIYTSINSLSIYIYTPSILSEDDTPIYRTSVVQRVRTSVMELFGIARTMVTAKTVDTAKMEDMDMDMSTNMAM